MTKFEEEFKALTSWDWVNVDLLQQILTKFGNWHSEEEFQELKESYWNQAESILLMLDEIKSLKSQLQQQALPVVPECVAVQIERVKNSNGNFATLGLFDWNHETKPDYTKWIHENVSDFMRACTIGYQVEKPQLFYLKNKMTTSYLALDINTGYYEHWGEEIIPKLIKKQGYKLSFTQKEINSMDAGSYEQIEVTE